jgi:hypothetical protein
MVRMLGPGGMQKKQKFHDAGAAAVEKILTLQNFQKNVDIIMG